MYGSNVYNIRSEFQQSKMFLLKIGLIFIGLGLFFFVAKQLAGVPFDYILQNMRNLTGGTGGTTVSLKDVFLKNQLVQSIVVFFTGLMTLISRFADDIKKIISEQWI